MVAMTNVFTIFRRGIGAKGGVLWALFVTVLYISIGCLVYMLTEPGVCDDLSDDCKWTFTDSVYFCTVTMSTVGYGDLSPTLPGTKVFTLVWIIIGIVSVFSAVASAMSNLIHPLTQLGRTLLEKQFPQTPVDLNGDGTIDYMKPRPAPIYYLKNLAPLFVLQHDQSAPLAVPQLGSCASSARAWRLWAARYSQREAQPLAAPPPPQGLKRAASKVADFTGFDL